MVWRVKEAYSFDHAGVPVVVRAGTLLGNDDPRAVGREQYLERAEDAAQRSTGRAVETATATPGELRAVSKSTPSGTRVTKT